MARLEIKDHIMFKAQLKKICSIFIFLFSVIFIIGCAPLVPDNYLSPATIKAPQNIDGKWVAPQIVPISVKMLQTPTGKELLEPALKPQPYRIGSYDNLNIIVWGHPELSTVTSAASVPISSGSTLSSISQVTSNPAVIVQTDGTIFYPYVKRLKVAGFTIEEVQDKIAKKLSVYIRNPQVTVQVSQFRNRNVYILGEVVSPGKQPLTDKPLSLMEAISMAGGLNTTSSDPTHIYLVRGRFSKPIIFWLNAQSPQALMIAEQFPLQENDIVYVSGATFNSWNKFINTVFPTFTTYELIKGYR